MNACLFIVLCVNGSSFLHVVLWVGVAVGSRWVVSALQLLCTGPLGTWHVCLGVVIYLDGSVGGLLAFLDWLLGRRSKSMLGCKSWHFPLVECAFVYSLVFVYILLWSVFFSFRGMRSLVLHLWCLFAECIVNAFTHSTLLFIILLVSIDKEKVFNFSDLCRANILFH